MITPYSLLQESGFSQYTAMVRFTYNRENTSLGAEKLAEMVRAIPGSTRVSTVSLDKENGIAIFNVKLISAKTPKQAFCAFKKNALQKFKGMLLKVEVGAGTIEKKGDFILMKEGQESPELLLEVSIEELRNQFVAKGKLPEDVFDRIVRACGGKSNYATWLCARVANNVCSEDAIETWGERFAVFDRNKSRFQTKDLNTLKTPEQIQNWVQNEFIPVCRDTFKKNISGGSTVDDAMIARLEQCQVSDFKSEITDREYYVFRLGKKDFDVEKYLGSGTTWCTRNSKETYDTYISRPDIPGTSGDYWIFVNKSNPGEKWQLLVKSGYFCNRNDENFLKKKAALPCEMLKFLKDKYGQQFTPEIRNNIKWLEQSILSQDDSNSDLNINVEQYLIGVESSYKAYKLGGSDESSKILASLGLYKNARVATVALSELKKLPIAVIYNSGSKKADPLFVGVYTGTLFECTDSDYNIRFIGIKNENEYKLLKKIQQETGYKLNTSVDTAWNADLPSLDTFRFNGRDDVWCFEPSEIVDRGTRACVQLVNRASAVTTTMSGDALDSMVLNWEVHLSHLLPVMSAIRRPLYVVRVGHFVGLVIPPGVRTGYDDTSNPTVDTNVRILFGNPEMDGYVAFKEKMDRAGVPYHFASEEDESNRSEFFYAIYASKFPTFESLSEFKLNPSDPEAGELWDFYDFPNMVRRAVLHCTKPSIFVKSKSRNDGDIHIIGFRKEGSTLCTTYIQRRNGGWVTWPGNISETMFDLSIPKGGRREETIQLLDRELRTHGVELRKNRAFSKYLSTDGETPNAGERRQSVPSFLRERENDLHPILFDWSRRGHVTAGRGLRLSWEEILPYMRASSPGVVTGVNNAIEAGWTLFDVYLFFNGDTYSDWNCYIRFVDEQRHVTRVTARTGRGMGLVWNSKDIPERNQITVDENGETVATAPTRQPRQPRDAANNPEPANNTPVEFNAEDLQRFRVTTQNAEDAYRASGRNAVQLLETVGFSRLAESTNHALEQNLGFHTLIYRIYPHRRGIAQWAAVIWGQGIDPLVGSLPRDPDLTEARRSSMSWRNLTLQLDNSVFAFQQLYDICEELHIPQTSAIQAWPNNRINRQ